MNRKDCFQNPGGDTIQMIKTKEYLEKNFPHLKISYGFNEKDIIEFNPEIIHIFNIQTFEETYNYIQMAKKNSNKIALSPIYWQKGDVFYVTKLYKLNIGINSITSHLAFLGRKIWSIYESLNVKMKNKIKYILQNSDILLPNSMEELEIIEYCFKVRKNYKIVYNSVDSKFLIFQKRDNQKDYINILTVGRIEPCKNQISTLKAINNLSRSYKALKFKYTIVGRISDDLYAQELYRLTNESKSENLTVILKNEIPHEKLVEEYLSSDIHILASFRESPGLTSLEALACGCKIIISQYPFSPVKTYFEPYIDKYAFTVNPYSVQSITEALNKAINYHNDNYINYDWKFTWDTSAHQTFEAYKLITSN